MEKAEIIHLSPDGLSIYLAGKNSDRENYDHFRKLTEDELHEKRAEFTNRAMEISKIEIELAIMKKSFKNRLEPLHESQDTVLGIIEAGEDTFHISCYPVYDFETGMMELYNDQGILVRIRPLSSYELQQRLSFVDEPAIDPPFESISAEEATTIVHDVISEISSDTFVEGLQDDMNKAMEKIGSKTKVKVSVLKKV